RQPRGQGAVGGRGAGAAGDAQEGLERGEGLARGRLVPSAEAEVSRALFALCAGAILLGTAGGEASPSRGAEARDPELLRRENLLADAEALSLRYRQVASLGREIAQVYLYKAKDLLEQGGAAESRDPVLRSRLAELYHLLQVDDKAIALYQALLRDNP